MSVRFRIRTAQGQELSFASQAVFVEFIRSGELAPEDLVYDGETNEWAPARTHALVLEIQYEEEERTEAAAAAEDEAEAPSPPTAADLGLDLADPLAQIPEVEGTAWPETTDAFVGAGPDDLGLDLAPPAESPSPDEASAGFLRKLEAERAMDLDAPGGGSLGIRMEDSGSLADMIGKADSPTMADRPAVRPEKRASSSSSPRPAEKPKKASPGFKVAIFGAVAAVLGVGAWLGAASLEEPALADPVQPTDTAPRPPAPPPPAPTIASTPEAVRARAQERFLGATQALLRDLPPIPDTWLSAPYFALPNDHDDVRATWQSYLDMARLVRAGDDDRYRTAYERALDEAAMRGEARTVMLATALDAFAARTAVRNAHWDRVEALAVAAIQSHVALVEIEGRVLHDATGATGRPEGIGEGISGRDPDSQLRITQVIDLLDARLDADGMGPGEGANVREWVWSGFLDAITH